MSGTNINTTRARYRLRRREQAALDRRLTSSGCLRRCQTALDRQLTSTGCLRRCQTGDAAVEQAALGQRSTSTGCLRRCQTALGQRSTSTGCLRRCQTALGQRSTSTGCSRRCTAGPPAVRTGARQWLAVDRVQPLVAIRCISAGSGDPVAADCGLPVRPGSGFWGCSIDVAYQGEEKDRHDDQKAGDKGEGSTIAEHGEQQAGGDGPQGLAHVVHRIQHTQGGPIVVPV
jgi:(2Fe-2S) ferredoxin